jgi:hypothetical protein
MEVHAPHGSVSTWKDFLLHLATVTVGILIALSLEQATVWYHHKAMVREAETNIQNEIRDNKKSLDAALPKMKQNLDDQEIALRVVQDLLKHKKLERESLTIGFNGPTPSSTSWRAAEAIGALSFMEYPRLKLFAGVYEMQGEYMRLQQHAVDLTINAVTFFREGFEKQGDRDLDEARRQLLASISAGRIQMQVAKQLSEEYGKVPGHRE